MLDANPCASNYQESIYCMQFYMPKLNKTVKLFYLTTCTVKKKKNLHEEFALAFA